MKRWKSELLWLNLPVKLTTNLSNKLRTFKKEWHPKFLLIIW
jgi:hypothetical protein